MILHASANAEHNPPCFLPASGPTEHCLRLINNDFNNRYDALALADREPLYVHRANINIFDKIKRYPCL